MSSTETIGFRVEAQLNDFLAEFAKIPGVTDKQARAAFKKLDTNLTKMRRAAEKQARAQSKAYDKAFDDMSGAAERTASLMGGVFGDISDSIIDLGGRFAELSGSLGGTKGAIVGLAGGFAAVSAGAAFGLHAIMEWMDGVDELRDRLKLVAGLPPLAAAHEAALDEYAEAARDAEAVSARMSLTVQGELAPAMTNLQHALIGASDAARSLGGDESGLVDYFTTVARRMALSGPASAVVVKAYDHLVARGEEVAGTISHITEEQRKAKESLGDWADAIQQSEDEIRAMAATLGYDYGSAVEDLDEKNRKAAESQRRLEEATRKQREEWVKANAEVALVNSLVQEFDDRVQAERDSVREAAKAEREWAAGLNKVRQAWSGVEEEAEEALEAIGSPEARRARGAAFWEGAAEGMATAQGFAERLTSTVSDLASVRIQAHQDEAAAIQRLYDKGVKRREQEKERTDLLLEQGKLSEFEHHMRISEIEEQHRVATARKRQEMAAQREAARRAFSAQQGAAITEAVMQGAINYMKALSFFIPALGPFAPGAAAALTVPQTVAQVAMIRAQKPPELPTGGVVRDRSPGMTPDHAVIGIQRGIEGVLSHQGVQAAGGPAGVAAMNRGQRPQGGGEGAVVMLDGQIIGAAVQRVLRRPALGRELDRRAGTLPGIRRR